MLPLRDYFLREINYARVKRPPGDSSFLLVQRFGELMRKLWNPRNFKAHVSPHEMLQAVVLWSRKKFQFTEQGELESFSRLVSSWSRKVSSTVLLVHFKSYICVCPAVSYKYIKPFSYNSVIKFGYLRINLYSKVSVRSIKLKQLI